MRAGQCLERRAKHVGRRDAEAGAVYTGGSSSVSRILAEPTLTAISGESAKFMAGGEIPVPLLQWSDLGAMWFETPSLIFERSRGEADRAVLRVQKRNGCFPPNPTRLERRSRTCRRLPSGHAFERRLETSYDDGFAYFAGS